MLLPCAVSVIEKDEKNTEIVFVDPHKMFGAFMEGSGNEKFKEIADTAATKLHAALDSIN